MTDTPKLPGNTPPSSPVSNSGDGESRLIVGETDGQRLAAARTEFELAAVGHDEVEPPLADDLTDEFLDQRHAHLHPGEDLPRSALLRKPILVPGKARLLPRLAASGACAPRPF